MLEGKVVLDRGHGVLRWQLVLWGWVLPRKRGKDLEACTLSVL